MRSPALFFHCCSVHQRAFIQQSVGSHRIETRVAQIDVPALSACAESFTASAANFKPAMPCACSVLDLVDAGVVTARRGTDPFVGPEAKPHYQPRLPLKPVHMRLELEFAISERAVNGVVTCECVSQQEGARELVLAAVDFESVAVTSPDGKLEFWYDGESVRVMFAEGVAKGGKVAVCVEYVVKAPRSGLEFGKDWVVSDHETERARYWLPCVDHPVVRTTLDFVIKTTASDGLTVLCNGELVGEVEEGNVKVTTWKMEQITPSYLLCVAIGKFIRRDVASHHGKPISYFTVAGRNAWTSEDLELTFGRTPEMIEFMEKKVSFDLPWPKYFQWAVGDVGGAMENSSLVSYDEWYMCDERSAPERSLGVDSTVVHELAHTWFGDMVVCADFAHSFLKESFATMISAEWYHYKYGVDEFQHRLDTWARWYIEETSNYMRPIVNRKYENSWQMFDMHLYPGGAFRLHMLRVKLGDAVFWGGVSAYLHKHQWQTVEADDLRHALEEFSGEELCCFFDQWFYGKGYPVLVASFSYDGETGGYATVSVKQTQANESDGIGLFDIAVEVAMEVSEDKWETRTVRMDAGKSSAQLATKVDTKPLQVVIDPDSKLLHKLKSLDGVGEDMLLRTLEKGPTYAGRRMAVKLLHESGSKKARAGLYAAVKSEPYWGLRSTIAETISKTRRPDALSALVMALKSESDARVLPDLVGAIGEFRDERAEETLREFVSQGHKNKRGYGAIAKGIRGLGHQRNVKDIELIAEFLEDANKCGRGTEIQLGAAAALGKMRNNKALDVLKRNVSRSDNFLCERVRAAVLRALAAAVEWEGPVVRREVCELVMSVCSSDTSLKVRMAAGSAAASLSDAGEVNKVLVELEKDAVNQDVPLVRKFKKQALSRADGREGASAATATALEKTQKELAALKSRMDDLQSKYDARLKAASEEGGEGLADGSNGKIGNGGEAEKATEDKGKGDA